MVDPAAYVEALSPSERVALYRELIALRATCAERGIRETSLWLLFDLEEWLSLVPPDVV